VPVGSLTKHKYIKKYATYWQVKYYETYGDTGSSKNFSFGIKSLDNEAEALLKAIAFRDSYEKYRPISKKLGPKKAINKIDHHNNNNESLHNIKPTKNIKPKIKRINNKPKHEHEHIRKTDTRFRVNYFDEFGIERDLSFSFGIKSLDNEEEALAKALDFRDEHEKYRPPHKKRESKKKAIPKISHNDNESIMSCESKGNQSGENSNNHQSDDCSSNSDTVTMSEDELKKEMKKIKTTPIESIVLGVNLDLLKNKYEVAFTEGGYLKLTDFNFGQDEEYKNWVEARFFAEKLREEKNNLLLLNK
jgi:hypothetical protein